MNLVRRARAIVFVGHGGYDVMRAGSQFNDRVTFFSSAKLSVEYMDMYRTIPGILPKFENDSLSLMLVVSQFTYTDHALAAPTSAVRSNKLTRPTLGAQHRHQVSRPRNPVRSSTRHHRGEKACREKNDKRAILYSTCMEVMHSYSFSSRTGTDRARRLFCARKAEQSNSPQPRI